MEEMNTTMTVEAEGTTPAEEVIQAEDSGETVVEDTTPDDTTAESLSSEQDSPVEPIVTVKYNHEERYYTAEQAATELQKRMHRDAQIELLAAAAGIDPEKYCDEMLRQIDAKRREDLEAQFGDPDLAEKVMAAERFNRRSVAEAAAAKRKATDEAAKRTESQRLADGFGELQRSFPEIRAIDDVPDSVIKMASEKQISLLDAMLRVDHVNQAAVKAAQAQAVRAAELSTGELGGADVGTIPEIEAMKRALWG